MKRRVGKRKAAPVIRKPSHNSTPSTTLKPWAAPNMQNEAATKMSMAPTKIRDILMAREMTVSLIRALT